MEISGAPRQVAGFPDVLGVRPRSHASSEMHELKGERGSLEGSGNDLTQLKSVGGLSFTSWGKHRMSNWYKTEQHFPCAFCL